MKPNVLPSQFKGLQVRWIGVYQLIILWTYCDAFTYSADKAGVMPGVTKGLQELVSGLDRELTAMAASPEQTVEVFLQTKQHGTHKMNNP